MISGSMSSVGVGATCSRPVVAPSLELALLPTILLFSPSVAVVALLLLAVVVVDVVVVAAPGVGDGVGAAV
jgi:hypothetical protein